MPSSSLIKKHPKKLKSSISNTLILNKLKESYNVEAHALPNIIGTSHNKVSKFFTGEKDISVRHIHLICKHLAIHPAHLLDDIFSLED